MRGCHYIRHDTRSATAECRHGGEGCQHQCMRECYHLRTSARENADIWSLAQASLHMDAGRNPLQPLSASGRHEERSTDECILPQLLLHSTSACVDVIACRRQRKPDTVFSASERPRVQEAPFYSPSVPVIGTRCAALLSAGTFASFIA